jgi:hypothetical protein
MMAFLTCKQKHAAAPSHLLDKDQMAKILAEIHLKEGVINNYAINNSDTTSFLYRKVEADIFKKYAVDTNSYYESYKYYLIHPEEFTDMYKQVIVNIKAQNRLDSLAEAQKPKTKNGHKNKMLPDSVPSSKTSDSIPKYRYRKKEYQKLLKS